MPQIFSKMSTSLGINRGPKLDIKTEENIKFAVETFLKRAPLEESNTHSGRTWHWTLYRLVGFGIFGTGTPRKAQSYSFFQRLVILSVLVLRQAGTTAIAYADICKALLFAESV
jgi:hypothetical protein